MDPLIIVIIAVVLVGSAIALWACCAVAGRCSRAEEEAKRLKPCPVCHKVPRLGYCCGERPDRRRWRREEGERVAAVGEGRRRSRRGHSPGTATGEYFIQGADPDCPGCGTAFTEMHSNPELEIEAWNARAEKQKLQKNYGG